MFGCNKGDKTCCLLYTDFVVVIMQATLHLTLLLIFSVWCK